MKDIEFIHYWEEEEILNNPYCPLVEEFWNEKNDNERLKKTINLVEIEDVYITTALIEDFIDTFRGKEQRTDNRFQLYMSHPSYAELLYQRAIRSLKSPGVNSSYTDRIDHVAIMDDYIAMFLKPADMMLMVEFMKHEPERSFFHFKAFFALWNVIGTGTKDGMEFLLDLFSKSQFWDKEYLTFKKEGSLGIDYETSYNYWTPIFLFKYAIKEVFPLQMEFLRSDKFSLNEKYGAFENLRFNKCIPLKQSILDNLGEINSIFKLQFEKEDGLKEWNMVDYLIYKEDQEYFDKVLNVEIDFQNIKEVKEKIETAINCAGIYQSDQFLKLPKLVLESGKIPLEVKIYCCKQLIHAQKSVYNYYHAEKPELFGKCDIEINTFIDEQKNKFKNFLGDEKEKQLIQNFLDFDIPLMVSMPEYEYNSNIIHRWYYS